MTEETKKYISFSELWKIDGYFQVYQWPVAELKQLGFDHVKKLANSYLIRVIAKNKNLVHFEFCPIADYYGDVSVKNISCEKDGLVSHDVFSKILHLISKQYKDEKEERENLDHETKIKQFTETRLDQKSLLDFSKQITQDYWRDFFANRADIGSLNIDKLAVSALSSFIEFFYTLETEHNYVEKEDDSDMSESEDEEEEREKENEREELNSLVQNTMFYDHYPLFKDFAKNLSDLSKDEIPNGDCLCGSSIEELNFEYGLKLVDYLRKNIKN